MPWREGACLLATVAALGSASPARARSRDFSAPPEVVEPPQPRAGLYLSFGVGADFQSARWHEPNPILHGASDAVGLRLGGRVGVVIRERTLLFAAVDGRGPLVPPVAGLYIGAVGLGASLFPRRDGPWHLDVVIHRGWGTKASFDLVAYTPPPVRRFDEVWLAEVGLGHTTRRGHADRGWSLALQGGLLRATASTGWLAAVTATYAWSRS